jgi:hypothetical protein
MYTLQYTGPLLIKEVGGAVDSQIRQQRRHRTEAMMEYQRMKYQVDTGITAPRREGLAQPLSALREN